MNLSAQSHRTKLSFFGGLKSPFEQGLFGFVSRYVLGGGVEHGVMSAHRDLSISKLALWNTNKEPSISIPISWGGFFSLPFSQTSCYSHIQGCQT